MSFLNASPVALSDRIAEARRRKGMTQQELAESVGVSRDTISRLENGDGGTVGYGTVLAVLDTVGYSIGLTYGASYAVSERPPAFDVRAMIADSIGVSRDAL